jgi:hypothetical protein
MSADCGSAGSSISWPTQTRNVESFNTPGTTWAEALDYEEPPGSSYKSTIAIQKTLRGSVGRCQALNTFLIIDMEVGSPSEKPTISNRRKT